MRIFKFKTGVIVCQPAVNSNVTNDTQMDVADKIKYHHDNKKYCKVQRQVAENTVKITNGYVVDYSDNFVLMQETDDFEVCGYLVFPVQTIAAIRLNNNDKYYDKIMRLEGLTEKVENKHKIDLSSWATIFKSIKKLGFNVIVENENLADESFDIGPITKITKSSVYVRYFNAKGFLNHEPTKINWDLMTIVKFDDRYINIFSKYLREQKFKKE